MFGENRIKETETSTLISSGWVLNQPCPPPKKKKKAGRGEKKKAERAVRVLNSTTRKVIDAEQNNQLATVSIIQFLFSCSTSRTCMAVRAAIEPVYSGIVYTEQRSRIISKTGDALPRTIEPDGDGSRS